MSKKTHCQSDFQTWSLSTRETLTTVVKKAPHIREYFTATFPLKFLKNLTDSNKIVQSKNAHADYLVKIQHALAVWEMW